MVTDLQSVAGSSEVPVTSGHNVVVATGSEAKNHVNAPLPTSQSVAKGRKVPRLSFAFLLVCAFITFVYTVCGGPVYETNDDIGLSMISAGIGFADKPDDHLHYAHYLIGRALNGLYGIDQNLPWYGLFLLCSQVLSLTVITRIFLSKGMLGAGLFAAVVFLFGACLRPVFFMQFTSTSALLATAGALILLVAAEKGKSLALRQLIPSICLIAGGAMIRCESAKMILLLTALAVATRFLLKLEWRKLLLGAISVAVALAAVFAVEFSNKSYYCKDEWREFHSLYSAYFPMIHKYVELTHPRSLEAFRTIGWNPSDLGAFRRWYMLDSTKYSVEKLDKLNSMLSPLAPGVTPEFLARKFVQIFSDVTVCPMIIAVLGALLCLGRSRFSMTAGVLFLASVGALCVYLLAELHLPPRVYACIMNFALLVLLWYSSPVLTTLFSTFRGRCLSGGALDLQSKLLGGIPRDAQGQYAKMHLVVLSIIPYVLAFCLLVAPFVPKYQLTAMHTDFASQKFKEGIKTINPSAKDLYVIWGPAFPFESIRPFDNLNDYFANWKLVWMGAYSRSPMVVSRLKQFGIKDPVLECDKPNLFHISCFLFNTGLNSYLSENFGKKLVIEKTITNMSDIKLNVYKLGMINLADSAASDLSAQCPDFGPSDRVLFPGDNFELHDLEPVEQKNGTTTYKLTGKDAQMILRKPLEISPEEFPTLLVETWTEPWIVDYRDLGIQIKEPRRETGRTILLPSRQDGKFHRYAFDLRRKSLKPGERITLIDFKPVRQRYESYGETVALRRISLSRVPLPPPDVN